MMVSVCRDLILVLCVPWESVIDIGESGFEIGGCTIMIFLQLRCTITHSSVHQIPHVDVYIARDIFLREQRENKREHERVGAVRASLFLRG